MSPTITQDLGPNSLASGGNSARRYSPEEVHLVKLAYIQVCNELFLDRRETRLRQVIAKTLVGQINSGVKDFRAMRIAAHQAARRACADGRYGKSGQAQNRRIASISLPR